MTDDSRRREWLAERRTIVTASDAAAILGVGKGYGALAVYLNKVEGAEREETPEMRRGRRLEPIIADEYHEETGREVIATDPYEIRRHPGIPWLGATLDRLTVPCAQTPGPLETSPVPLEIKAVGAGKAHEWSEEPPLGYQIQCQVQMACTGAQWGSIVALVGGLALSWADLLRDESFLSAALPKLEAFWLRVQRREPPEADTHEATLDLLKRVWPSENRETVALDAKAQKLAEQLEEAEARAEESEGTARRLESALRLRLGAASYGALPDGTFLSLREVRNPGYTRAVEPYTYRVLRRVRNLRRLGA